MIDDYQNWRMHMNNNNDEMYEVNDLDEDIRLRENLLEEAKNIDGEADWNEIFRTISELKRRWKRIPYWESAYEDTLEEEFDRCLDVFYGKRREGFKNNEELKQNLIARAQKASMSDNWNQATEEMNNLMAEWKTSGSAGREVDDTLWEAFNAARQTFFDRKHQHWEELQAKFENARKVKSELIVQAAALADSQDWQKTSDAFKDLMDQWKAVGSAGKEHEDNLWKEFNTSRQKFYERRSVHYDQMRDEQDQKYEEKKALVEQAKAISSSKEYTREHTEQMKQLGVAWKQIGSCGRDREDEIWKEFRGIMDIYFEGLKQWNEQRHTQWRQRMLDARSRKMEMIQNQKRQVKYMQEEMVGLLGQRAIDEMEESIQEKQEFIKELEADLADIDKSLEQK